MKRTKEEMEQALADNWDMLSAEDQQELLSVGFPIRKLKGVMQLRQNSIKQFVKSK